jgi:hypothetical protein
MKPWSAVLSVPVLLLVAVTGTAAVLSETSAAGSIAYRFDEVKSKVLRLPGGDEDREVRVSAGESAGAGDVVRTGYWARTVLSVPERACRFEISSSTRVRLAGGEPGVVLSLESGRLSAFFEKFTGKAEERRVAAPGALLVVRGTKYGLETGSGDQATLAVFEGTVEVVPTTPGVAPFKVTAGEYGVFGAKTAPRKGQMPRGVDEGTWRSRGAGALPGVDGGQQGPGNQAPSSGASPSRGGQSGPRGKS